MLEEHIKLLDSFQFEYGVAIVLEAPSTATFSLLERSYLIDGNLGIECNIEHIQIPQDTYFYEITKFKQYSEKDASFENTYEDAFYFYYVVNEVVPKKAYDEYKLSDPMNNIHIVIIYDYKSLEESKQALIKGTVKSDEEILNCYLWIKAHNSYNVSRLPDSVTQKCKTAFKNILGYDEKKA